MVGWAVTQTGGILRAPLPGRNDWTTVQITGARKMGTMRNRTVLALSLRVAAGDLGQCTVRGRSACVSPLPRCGPRTGRARTGPRWQQAGRPGRAAPMPRHNPCTGR